MVKMKANRVVMSEIERRERKREREREKEENGKCV
jgi:hypothetical protein